MEVIVTLKEYVSRRGVDLPDVDEADIMIDIARTPRKVTAIEPDDGVFNFVVTLKNGQRYRLFGVGPVIINPA